MSDVNPYDTMTDAPPTDDNPYRQFVASTDAGEPGLLERFKLNQTDGYYRGTLAGAADLSRMATIKARVDAGATDDDLIKEFMPALAQERPDQVNQRKGRLEQLRAQADQYDSVVADLARYDLIAPWGTSAEGAAALAGHLVGGLQTPESFLGAGAKGASLLVRGVKAAAQQGAISGLSDPIIQWLNIKSNVQNEYEPMRTAAAVGLGAIIGGGLHVGGELLSSRFVKAKIADAAKEDPQLRSSEGVPAEATVAPIDAAAAPELPQPAPDTIRLYRGEGAGGAAKPGEVAHEGSGMTGGWFTTDLEKAKLYGDVKYIDVTRDDLAHFAQGHGGPDEFVTDNSKFRTEAKPIENSEVPAVAAQEPAISRSPEQQALIDKRNAIEVGDELALAARRGGSQLSMERSRPDTGIPAQQAAPGTGTALATVPETASVEQGVAIRSLQQQAMDFADAIGFPLRQGRNRKGTLGTYNTGSGVVRVKEVPDFEVVAHEAGHAIEAKIGQDLTDVTELFPNELKALDYDQTKRRVNEGFAEWMRRYIGNPAHAQQVAPTFTAAFRDFMSKAHPEMLAEIDKASAAYRAYLEAPSVDAIGAVVRSRSEEAHGWRGVVQKIRDEGLPAITKTVVQNIYRTLLDDKAPVTLAVRDLARAIRDQSPEGTLVNLKAADNPEVMLRLFERSHQSAVRDMMDGVRGYHQVTPEGPSLTGALEKATGGVNSGGWGKWDPELRSMFSDYMVARRAALLWDKFNAGELANPPVAFSKADAVVAMAELERANPTFREASDMVHAWTRQLLKKQFDGGLIDADLFNRLSREEFYVPFMRDLSDRPMAGGGGTRGSSDGPGMTQTVKKMKGSSRDIKDPIESLMTQAFLVNRTLAHNDILKAFVRLAEQAKGEGGHYVEKVPAHEFKKYSFDLGESIDRLAAERNVNPDDAKVLSGALTDVFGEDPVVGSFFRQEPAGKRGEPIVFYKEGGQLQAARFMSGEEGHALYEALTALPQPLTDAWSRMIAATTSTLRAGITTNPMFALTNYIRDQFAVAILRNDYIPIISGVKGVAAELGQKEPAVLYGYGGGVSGGASIAPLEKAIESDVNALAKKGYLVNRLTSFKGAMDLAAVTEAGTRNSVFEKVYNAKKAQGLNDYEAMIEAAFSAQDILDFSRHGSRTEAIRKYIPFINAWAQGLDKARRTMVSPIIEKIKGDQVYASDPAAFNNALLSMGKLFGVGGVLGAGWAAIHADSQAYQDVSPQIKGTHVVIPLGNKIVLVPKPFELGAGFTMGEYAFQKWAKDDPRAAEQFASAMWDSLTSGNPFTDIPLVKQYFELKSGKNLFTGRDIVPGTLQRLKPEFQYTDKTSALAKQIGQMIGVSPIKVDYAIGSTFGLWGRDIMALSSGVDPDAPAQSWEDRVFVRRLLKDPARTSDVTTRFWDYMGQTTGKYNQSVATYDDLVKKFHDTDAKQFLEKLPSAERAFVIMKSAATEDGKPAFKADEKRLHPLQRAYDAVTILNGLRRELNDNAFKNIENGANLKLDPVMRRDLIENVRELAQMEMRNSFVIMKEPGYAGRPLFDVNATMDKIMALSPTVGEEIATRYATNRIYKTDAVAQAYPKMQQALLSQGSNADIASLAGDAKGEYEFGGDRVKKAPKRRVQIQPSP